MAIESKSQLVRQLRFVVAAWKEDGRTDVELLGRFCESQEEHAFTTLVGRYSALVWGACVRVLRNQADAEDAFQATFLRLARDAARIQHRHNLSTWLYRVARCSAIDLRRANEKHRRIEERLTEVADRSASGSNAAEHLRTVLDDELEQLPERYRAVLILCHLEGRTYADASLELGCSVAAVHRMATRAQDLLRRRLVKHGYAAAGATGFCLVAGFAGEACAAPPRLLAASVLEGLKCARAGVLPASKAGLIAAAVPAATGGKLAATAAVGALLFGAVAAGAFVFGPPAIAPAVKATADAGLDPAVAARSRTVPMTGTVVGPDGRPNPGATVVALARTPYEPRDRGLRDAVVARTAAGPNGRFTLHVPVGRTGSPLKQQAVAVQVSHVSRSPVSRAVRLDEAPGRGPEELGEFRLEPAVGLSGRLLDPAGRPAAGVAVRVVRVGDVVAEPVIGDREPPAHPGWPAPVRTGADGAFALPGLGNVPNVWVRVADPRFALDTLRIDAPPAECRLTPARTVEVRVTAADTGRPLANTRITLLTQRLRSHPYFCVADAAVVSATAVPPGEIDFLTDARGCTRVGLQPGEAVEVLVHPPAGQPYVGVRRQLAPGEAGRSETLAVELPRGRWVEGVALDDATGEPVAGAAVHWGREDTVRPEWRDEFLVGRDAITRTGVDGKFQLAVLPGPVSIRVYGPSLDYLAVPVPLTGTKGTTLFAHHVERLAVPASSAGPPPVVARLRKGQSGECRVDGPAATRLIALASGRVSPVRGYASLPMPAGGGGFVVAGCAPGAVTRTYFLDPIAQVGGIADVGAGGRERPAVRLEPCGQARVRVTTEAGEPIPGCEVIPSLLLDRDRPAGAEPPTADPQPADWFDPVNYARRPVTADDGTATLPALIPGANYTLNVLTPAGRVRVGPFRAVAGETIELAPVVASDSF